MGERMTRHAWIIGVAWAALRRSVLNNKSIIYVLVALMVLGCTDKRDRG